MNQTIETVVNNGLCTGCGTCSGVCSFKAIKMVVNSNGLIEPSIAADCTHCGVCLQVCSGNELDLKKLNSEIFNKQPENRLIGNFLNCYVGYSNDGNIRLNAASGGLVTSLLIFALKEGIIDGAILTRMNKHDALKPQIFIARTPTDIISSQGSKYCPVPLNAALREILKTEGKYAVVGLPCHIQGIRKAESLNPILRKRIVLHLGIFCSHTTNLNGTAFLLKKNGIDIENITALSYRGGGWPGSMTIKLSNGQVRKLPYRTYSTGLFNLFFFTPKRCLLCTDMTSELADISFGDAWFPEYFNDQIGTSIAIARASLGKNLLDCAAKNAFITLTEIPISHVLKQHANKGTMRLKKSSKAQTFPFVVLQKQTPMYPNTLVRSKPRDFLISLLAYLNAEISLYPKLWCTIPFLSRLTKVAAKSARR